MAYIFPQHCCKMNAHTKKKKKSISYLCIAYLVWDGITCDMSSIFYLLYGLLRGKENKVFVKKSLENDFNHLKLYKWSLCVISVRKIYHRSFASWVFGCFSVLYMTLHDYCFSTLSILTPVFYCLLNSRYHYQEKKWSSAVCDLLILTCSTWPTMWWG